MIINNLKYNLYDIQVNRVTTDSEFQDFFNTLSESFVDEPWEIPEYQETYDYSKPLIESDDGGDLLVFYIDGKAIAHRYIIYNQEMKLGYVPWGGLIKKYQGQGMYPFLINSTEYLFLDKGIDIVINECEVPSKVDNSEVASSRIRMFSQKLGYNFIDPTNFPYIRNNAYGDLNEEWNWYMLGFKILNPETNLISRKGITKEDYKRLYLALRFFELEILDEEELKNKSKALKYFLEKLEQTDQEFKFY